MNLGGWESTQWREGDTHVVPLNDLREHEQYTDCWCNPVENEANIWVHNALDQRERLEDGGRLDA